MRSCAVSLCEPSKRIIQSKYLAFRCAHHSSLLIISHSLLKKVCFALNVNHVHPLERIRCSKKLTIAQLQQEAISDGLNVLRHELSIHTDEINR